MRYEKRKHHGDIHDGANSRPQASANTQTEKIVIQNDHYGHNLYFNPVKLSEGEPENKVEGSEGRRYSYRTPNGDAISEMPAPSSPIWSSMPSRAELPGQVSPRSSLRA